jgi:hypothetical protein
MDETARKSIADNLRFYADARFKQLTIFITWMTLLIGGLLQLSDKPVAVILGLTSVIPIAALLITSVFWIMEIRATLYWRTHRDQSPDLWPAIPRDGWRHLNATNGIFALYLSSYCAWVAAFIKLSASCWISALAVMVGIVIFIFGVVEYAKYSDPGSTLKKKDG